MSRIEALAMPLEASSAADPARIRGLITKHADFLWRSLIRLGVPRADAADALQEVLLVASRRLDVIEACHERSFLYGIVLRIASRARRTQARRREVLDDVLGEHLDPTPGADDLLDQARARSALEGLLDALPIELRAVFTLFELEQLTMAEIAALLDLPPGTVASRLRRAREHFQDATRQLAARGGA